MEDTVEIMDNSTTRVLPHEILSQIFAFLPLTDRQCVRLTCRSWYDCCASVNITKHEKFVFRSGSGIAYVAEVILQSKYSLLNLEFHHLPVKMLPANVWKVCGPRIRKLEFYTCRWDDQTMSNIIFHCENLTNLVIFRDTFSHPIPNPCSPRLLCDFIQKRIQRPNLHTLSICFEHDDDESILRRMFLIYPRIKHLSVTGWPYASFRLDQFLNPDTRLESLTCRRFKNGLRIETLVNGAEQGLMRLKHFETDDLMYDSTMEDTIFNFFKSHKTLEIIKLTKEGACENLFYSILKSCPNLHEFSLYRWRKSTLVLKPSEVPQFIASISKLKSLELIVELDNSERIPSFYALIPNTIQLNLISLHWDSGADSDFRVALLQRCTSLRHLNLADCCDSTLQIIFQHLPELRTLILLHLHNYLTDFGFSGRTADGNEEDGYSIKRLKQLRHLELCDYKVRVTERAVLEFVLPRLEFLALNERWYAQLSEDTLNHFASQLPELRVFVINTVYDKPDCVEGIQFCKNLSKLHRIDILEFNFIQKPRGKQLVEKLFSVCPNLKKINDRSSTAIRRFSKRKI